MYELLAKLMLAGKLKFEQGKINFASQYMTWLPLKTLKFMTLEAIKEGQEGINKLYLIGWHFGYIFTDSYMQTFSLKPFEETFKMIMDVAVLIGYGDYKTLEFKQKHHSKFVNIDNPFGKLFYPSKEKHCIFIRGVNAGGGTALHQILMNGIELECTANNNKQCLFMNLENSVLQSQYPEFMKEQVDLKWLTPRQLKIIKENGQNPNTFVNKV